VVRGLRGARIGAIGARPNAFHTVRFSEKLLQNADITTVVCDFSDIIARAEAIGERDAAVEQTLARIHAYGKVQEGISDMLLRRQARLILAIEGWVKESRCDAVAISCWDSGAEPLLVAPPALP
jgi:L-fucose isomerase-like protein